MASSHDELTALSGRLYSRFKRACMDHRMIAPDDHILVCLSGGKDSYTMLSMLRLLQARLPFEIRLTAYHLDQAQPGYPVGIMTSYFEQQGVEYVVERQDTYSVVQEKLKPDATPCSLCSRLRRGIIYTQARALGCNKIALGHHRDDSVETLMLNMLHSGQLQGMPGSYKTDDGEFEVLRPLIYCAEAQIARYAQLMEYPIIPCTLCGSVEGRRKWVKRLLDEIEQTIPQARQSILASMQNVRVSHLMDLELQERLQDEPGAQGDPDDVLRLVTNRPATTQTS